MINIVKFVLLLWCFSGSAQDTINYKADLYENCWLPEGGYYIEPIWGENECCKSYSVNLVDKAGSLLTNESRHRLIGMRFQVTLYKIDTTFVNQTDTIIMKKDSVASCDLYRTYWKDESSGEIKDAVESYPFTLVYPTLMVEHISEDLLSYKFYMYERDDNNKNNPVLISVGNIKLRSRYKYNPKKQVQWSTKDDKPYEVH